MLILPAIDLLGGRCVRLLNGRFDAKTDYGDPVERLGAFSAAGASWVHIVDLDGARMGAPVQQQLISELASLTALKLQSGGGVRARDDVEALLRSGVARVVVGSAAARDPKEVRTWLNAFGREQICLALDVRAVGELWEVVVHGWSEGSGATLDALLDLYGQEDVRHVLVTDVSRDGAMRGPNLALTRRLAQACPHIAFQASGGVAKLADLDALRAAGACAAIVGRALYEKRFTLEAALAL